MGLKKLLENIDGTLIVAFSTAIYQAGYQQSMADYSLFIKVCGNSFTVVLIYVNDMIITWN